MLQGSSSEQKRTALLDEKARQAEQESEALHREHDSLRQRFDKNADQLQKLNSELVKTKQDAESRQNSFIEQLNTHRQQQENYVRGQTSLQSKIQDLTERLQAKADEKTLLQTRHDALTRESEELQVEVGQLRSEVTRLQSDIEHAKERALKKEHLLKEEAESAQRHFTLENARLEANLESQRAKLLSEEDRWKVKHNQLQSQRDLLEQKVKGLERTTTQLQETAGTSSGQETFLRKAIESEKSRHAAEEQTLARQIDELQAELAQKCQHLEKGRSELSQIKAELRMSEQGTKDSNQKLQALDDEIVVLQSTLDEVTDRAKDEKKSSMLEIDSYRLQVRVSKEEICRLEGSRSEALLELQTLQSDSEAQRKCRSQLDERVANLEKQLTDVETRNGRLELELTHSQSDQRGVHGENSVNVELPTESKLSEMERLYEERILKLKDEIALLKEQHRHDRKMESPSRNSIQTLDMVFKDELSSLKDRLHTAHDKVDEFRRKLKDAHSEARLNLIEANTISQKQDEELQNLRDQLEHQAHDLNIRKEEYKKEGEGNEKTISRLRSRVHSLEKELHDLRLTKLEDQTMAVERQDLHDMLKSAKLEAEDLQHQLNNCRSRLDAASEREKGLRDQVQRRRAERDHEQNKVSALARELETLQDRYDNRLEEIRAQRQSLREEDDARLITHTKQARRDVETQDKRHCAEIKGLAKQIEWLRARCQRERAFRECLIYEKVFLSMQVDMFQAW